MSSNNFYPLMHRLDPSGVLNVPLKVFTDNSHLKTCFKTIRDFEKFDVKFMCDQLYSILANTDDENSLNLTILTVQNNFQYKKYSFILISRTFIGIMLIYKESIKRNIRYFKYSIDVFYRKQLETSLKQANTYKTKTSKKKKRKNPNSITEAVNQPQCIELTQDQEIDLFHQNQVLSTSVDKNLILEPEIISIQCNQNFIPNLDEEENDNDQILALNQIEMSTENFPPQNNSTDQSLKRKRSSQSPKRNLKKKPIELSNKVLANQMKRIKGLISLDRPFECMITKYLSGSMNHLPLRHATYRNKFNIPFAAVTLDMELNETKNQDEVFNNEITMDSYKSITEKLNNSDISNTCIYQQCLNNSLPHLRLLPTAEEYSNRSSLVWRNTINEINKKLQNSLEDILISKNDQNKWEKIKENMKKRMTQCLISPELSRIDPPEPRIVFPSFHKISEPILKDNIMIETNEFTKTYIQNINKPAQIYQRESIDIKEMISVVLTQSSANSSCFMFTDLCPIRVTNRRRTISVMIKLLRLYQQGIVKLSQPYNTMEPSSIKIQLNMELFSKM